VGAAASGTAGVEVSSPSGAGKGAANVKADRESRDKIAAVSFMMSKAGQR